MKNKKISKKSLYLRIAAGVAGFVLLCICVTFTMSFTGNPISSFMAKKAAKEYVANKYPEYDMVIKDSMYNFKIGGYDVDVQDKDTQDIFFSVWYRDFDGIVGDNYEEMVVDRRATINRFENEMSEAVRPIIENIAKERGLEITGRCMASIFGSFDYDVEKLPPFDTPYSKELGLKGEYFIDFSTEEKLDIHEIADTILEIYTRLTDEGFKTNEIIVSFTSGESEMSVSVEEDLINEELADKIIKDFDEKEYKDDGLFVFVSGDESFLPIPADTKSN